MHYINLLLTLRRTKRPFFPGLPGWAGTRKVKPISILLKQQTASGSGITWAVCKSAHRSWQITTPAPHHSVFYRLDDLPGAQPTASKHWRQFIYSVKLLVPRGWEPVQLSEQCWFFRRLVDRRNTESCPACCLSADSPLWTPETMTTRCYSRLVARGYIAAAPWQTMLSILTTGKSGCALEWPTKVTVPTADLDPPSSTRFLGSKKAHIPNSIWINSAIFEGFTIVTIWKTYTQTTPCISVATGHIYQKWPILQCSITLHRTTHHAAISQIWSTATTGFVLMCGDILHQKTILMSVIIQI